MSKKKPSFLGPIEGIKSIYVDNFQNKDQQAYFLSHYHWDHTYGLSKTFLDHLEGKGVFIYASEVTAAIVKNEYKTKTKDYSNVLKVLKLGRNTVPITIDGEEETLDVIALDAKHCWGSLMFLFQYKGRNILYTGDFRITKDLLLGKEYDLLRENGKPIRIDKMYVDTTFKMVPAFPKRSVVVSKIVELVEKWWEADKDIQIHIITSALFAYEDICNAIYAKTGEKTKIRETKASKKNPRWQIYAQFPEAMPGIKTDESAYKIELYYSSKKPREKGIIKKENEDKNETDHVNENEPVNENDHVNANEHVNKNEQVNENKNENERESENKIDEKNKVKIIYLSAQSWVGKPNLLENFVKQEGGNVTKMCFATHCGNDELFNFITYLNRIVEIPVEEANPIDTLTSNVAACSINN